MRFCPARLSSHSGEFVAGDVSNSTVPGGALPLSFAAGAGLISGAVITEGVQRLGGVRTPRCTVYRPGVGRSFSRRGTGPAGGVL